MEYSKLKRKLNNYYKEFKQIAYISFFVGAGYFLATQFPSTKPQHPQLIFLGDFNGDKIMDAYFKLNNGNQYIYLGQKDGTFKTLEDFMKEKTNTQNTNVHSEAEKEDNISDLIKQLLRGWIKK